MKLYPLKFEEIYKEKIWGGDKLDKVYKRKLPARNIGESWEIAAHPHGTSIVKNGIFKGKSIRELVNEYPDEILGTKIDPKHRGHFPLLIKILDANDKLSVQVHPDDNYAARVENELGKTEMWYILEAQPGAKLVYGLKPGTVKTELAEAINNGSVERYLNEVEVKEGDIFYMPSGTIHAIEEGILLAEIQQNSDTTYRVYDWNRIGADGKARELHVEKALDVIDFNKDNSEARSIPLTIKNRDYNQNFLAACPYFVTERIEVKNKYHLNIDGKRFYIIINLEGNGSLYNNGNNYDINPGDTLFLPAGLNNIEITGQIDFLLTYLPSSKNEIITGLKKSGFNSDEIENLAGINQWND